MADDVNETPFIADDPTRSEDERLAALQKAFFAPGHGARPWLSGWYPETLAMQRAAVKATEIAKYWSSGEVKLLEIIARYGPFKPQSFWRELSNHLGDRVTTAVVEDAAHALIPEQPAQVAQVVIPRNELIVSL